MADIKTSKIAQSEAVGFVIIILIVIVIGVVFFGIFLRQNKGTVAEDTRIPYFLTASFNYKTSESCYKDSEPFYRSLGELAEDCYNQKGGAMTGVTCSQGKQPCDVLNETYSKMLLRFAPAGVVSYYKMSFTYNSSALQTKFLEITWGDAKGCADMRAGRKENNIGAGENIIAELEICEA